MGACRPTISQLRELVERASKDRPHLTSRLEKAAFLVLLRPIIVLADHRYRIGSEDGLRYYEVSDGHCQCSDYLRHGAGQPCKHRLAIALYQRLAFPGPPSPLIKSPCLPADSLQSDEEPQ